MRNAPNPVARNGTASPPYVSYRPMLLIVVTLVTMVTSNGTIRVARNTTNRMRLNGKRRNANAYPARIAVTT